MTRKQQGEAAKNDFTVFVHGTVAAAVGEFVNTAIFLTIAFAGVLPNLWSAILAAWIVKVIVGTLAMPILVTGRRILARAAPRRVLARR